jgi:hypothetical protein
MYMFVCLIVFRMLYMTNKHKNNSFKINIAIIVLCKESLAWDRLKIVAAFNRYSFSLH